MVQISFLLLVNHDEHDIDADNKNTKDDHEDNHKDKHKDNHKAAIQKRYECVNKCQCQTLAITFKKDFLLSLQQYS